MYIRRAQHVKRLISHRGTRTPPTVSLTQPQLGWGYNMATSARSRSEGRPRRKVHGEGGTVVNSAGMPQVFFSSCDSVSLCAYLVHSDRTGARRDQPIFGTRTYVCVRAYTSTFTHKHARVSLRGIHAIGHSESAASPWIKASIPFLPPTQPLNPSRVFAFSNTKRRDHSRDAPRYKCALHSRVVLACFLPPRTLLSACAISGGRAFSHLSRSPISTPPEKRPGSPSTTTQRSLPAQGIL